MKKILETLKQKWAEYLLEIIVITIGVLAAFGLNSWNTNRNEQKLKQEYVASLLSDLQEQSVVIEEQLEFESRRNTIASDLIEILRGGLSTNELDSAHYLIAGLLGRKTFTVINTTFIDLTNSGTLRLLSNDQKRMIISYYESLDETNDVISRNNDNVDFVSQTIITEPFVLMMEVNERLIFDKLQDFEKLVILRNLAGMMNAMTHNNISRLERRKAETDSLIISLGE